MPPALICHPRVNSNFLPLYNIFSAVRNSVPIVYALTSLVTGAHPAWALSQVLALLMNHHPTPWSPSLPLGGLRPTFWILTPAPGHLAVQVPWSHCSALTPELACFPACPPLDTLFLPVQASDPVP